MIYTLREVKKHNNLNSCWLIVEKNVYDITNFLKLHPEHINRIIKKAGENVTDDYNFHTKNQKKIWKQYKIGKIGKRYCNINNKCQII